MNRTTDRGFNGSVLLTLSLGGAAVGATVGLLAPASLLPLRPVLPAAPVLHGTDWSAPWTAAAQPPVVLQHAWLSSMASLLGGLALVVAALACVDLAFLVVALAAGRRHELAVHAAVGASRRRLGAARRAEAARLALVALGCALLLGMAGAQALRATWPAADWPMTLRSAGWALVGAALVPALGFVLYPALHWLGAPSRHRLRALSAGDHVTDASGDPGLVRGLAAGQAAAALALIVLSGLLARTGAVGVGPGVHGRSTPDTLLLSLDLRGVNSARRAGLLSALPGLAAGVPRVQAAGVATEGTWLGLGPTDEILAQCDGCSRGGMGTPLVPARVVEQAVGPGAFRALGIGLRKGRGVSTTDRAGAPAVAWVSRAFVSQVLQNNQALGKQVQLGGGAGAWYTIVGVVGDVDAPGIGAGGGPRPTIYLSVLQHPPRHLALAVRMKSGEAPSPGMASALASSTRTLLAGQGAPGGGVGDVLTLATALERFAAPVRWLAAVAAGLGVLALILAVLGAYAVMAQATTRRRTEMGLRAAVGAGRRRLMTLIMGEAIAVVALALAAGLPLAVVLARMVQADMVGLTLESAAPYGIGAACVSLALLAGAWRPAWRAIHVPPADALRPESD